MEKILKFLETDLEVGILLEKIKSKDLKYYSQFIESIKEFHELEFYLFYENENLNKFKLIKLFLNNPPSLLKLINQLESENKHLLKAVSAILKLYYLYYYNRYNRTSFELFIFTQSVFEATNVLKEFSDEEQNSSVLCSFHNFVKSQNQIVIDRIDFENQNRKTPILEGFIISLPPEFTGLFEKDDFVPLLIRYLFETKYITEYGTWIEKTRKKTIILGLLYSLEELTYIKLTEPFQKKIFCDTFKLSLTSSFYNSKKETKISRSTKMDFKVSIKELYIKAQPVSPFV